MRMMMKVSIPVEAGNRGVKEVLPIAAEPFFLNLNAGIEVSPAMNLDDMRAGVEKAMKRT
ncbi:MAG: hypothetical protein ABSE95_13240 [Thermodesulfobacteriota bacterium]